MTDQETRIKIRPILARLYLSHNSKYTVIEMRVLIDRAVEEIINTKTSNMNTYDNKTGITHQI